MIREHGFDYKALYGVSQNTKFEVEEFVEEEIGPLIIKLIRVLQFVMINHILYPADNNKIGPI